MKHNLNGVTWNDGIYWDKESIKIDFPENVEQIDSDKLYDPITHEIVEAIGLDVTLDGMEILGMSKSKIKKERERFYPIFESFFWGYQFNSSEHYWYPVRKEIRRYYQSDLKEI